MFYKLVLFKHTQNVSKNPSSLFFKIFASSRQLTLTACCPCVLWAGAGALMPATASSVKVEKKEREEFSSNSEFRC